MKPSVSPLVSVIIVNYRSWPVIRGCLESLRRADPSVAFEILVVDNDSPDDSAERIAESFPEVRLIKGGRNGGFGFGNNLGARAARGTDLLFLNPDTVVPPDALRAYVDFLHAPEREGRVGALGTRLVDADGAPGHSGGRFYRLRYVFSPVKRLLNRLRFTSSRERAADEAPWREIEYVTGAAMMVDRDFFLSLGGFDESFFMYHEEIELQYRMRKAGRPSFLFAGPRIVHLERSGDRLGERTRMWMDIGWLKFARKHRGVVYGELLRFWILCMILRQAAWEIPARRSTFAGFLRRLRFVMTGRYL